MKLGGTPGVGLVWQGLVLQYAGNRVVTNSFDGTLFLININFLLHFSHTNNIRKTQPYRVTIHNHTRSSLSFSYLLLQ